MPDIPAEWTKPERWVWAQIVAGSLADLIEYEPNQTDLVPHTKKGWGEERRLSSKFLETILTQKAFVEATPYGGVRILGAFIDDAPLILEHAHLHHQFCLEKSRILTEVKCRNLRVDGELSLGQCFVSGDVSLNGATVGGGAFLCAGATFKGGLDLVGAKIGSDLMMDGATFEGDVSLNSATVDGAAFLRAGATFKGGLNLVGAKIGSALMMDGATFEGDVSLNSATVDGAAFLCAGATFQGGLNLWSAKIGSALVMERATFKGGLSLAGAKIGSHLMMDGATFEGDVSLNNATVDGAAFLRAGATFKGRLNLGSAKISSNLLMNGATFERDVSLQRSTVGGAAFLRAGATFKGGLNLWSAKIGSALVMDGATFEGLVDLTECTVTGPFLLGFSEGRSAHWQDGASLTLYNTHVGALQDWWRGSNANAWPKTYRLGGFTYDRLGSTGVGKEADMLGRSVSFYLQWLKGDQGSSSQPYEHLADRFHEAGEPGKATGILYAARERRRRKAWSTVDDYGHAKRREWPRALGLSALNVTIGYGLGYRYFRVLWWVGGLTLVGAFVVLFFGAHSLAQWPRIFFASLDQLLPIVTLDKAHEVLIFGDLSAKPPVEAQPYGVLVYFYVHKILGWVLGSFLVAGLGGLTQRN